MKKGIFALIAGLILISTAAHACPGMDGEKHAEGAETVDTEK